MSIERTYLALSIYDQKMKEMSRKRDRGLITWDEWAKFIKDETTLWGIMKRLC